MNIVTGYKGEAHVTAQQDRYINQSAFGLDSYVLPTGAQLAATIDSATQVTLADGGVSIQGCVAVIEYGESEALAIESGTTGMSRIDLICARYTKNSSTGVEDVSLVVITGESTTGTATAPAYTEGSIEAGDTLVDFPIYKVVIDGVAIDSVTMIASTVKTAEELNILAAIPAMQWHLFSTGTTTWAAGTTTTDITVPEGRTGYTRFVIGLRSTSRLVSARWALSGTTITLSVYNEASSSVTCTINGILAYLNADYLITT